VTETNLPPVFDDRAAIRLIERQLTGGGICTPGARIFLIFRFVGSAIPFSRIGGIIILVFLPFSKFDHNVAAIYGLACRLIVFGFDTALSSRSYDSDRSHGFRNEDHTKPHHSLNRLHQEDVLHQEERIMNLQSICPTAARAGNNRAFGKDGSRVRYLSKLDQVSGLTGEERARLQPVTQEYAFRANDYYTSLIDWNDPDDPIRRIIIPEVSELIEGGQLDPSHEEKYMAVPGLEHKYEFTALLLVSNVCGGYCRFCFRKRLFMDGNAEVNPDVRQGIEYIRAHPEINNVLLTGGDPLMLSTEKLGRIIRALREIDHVQIIRIGSKMPAFNPYRILQDSSLEEMLREYSRDEKKIYLMAQFNHPRELTDEAVIALNLLQEAGVITVSQTPLLKGVNSDPVVLGDLFNRLSYIGVPPYYVFQCRPTAGNRHFAIPIEQGYEIFEQARMKCSGLAKRARFVMSHSSGKIEIVGKTADQIFMRYHRAANFSEKGRFFVFASNPQAYWFDDYREMVSVYSFGNPFLRHEPERCATPRRQKPRLA
jgi:lysine 2,3-aminomutase